MAFRRSPVRSRSGPPSFARASRELRMAGHPTQFTGGAPQTQASASRAKDGVPRSGAAAKVDCIGSSKSSACQYPRTSRVRADTSNRNTLSRLRTPTQFPAGFRRARTCTRPPHDRTESASCTSSTAPQIRLGITPASPRTSECGWPNTTEAVACTRRWTPWRVIVVVAFAGEKRALEFERYLKSGSGCAFAARHFR
jgi:hypothetical protein